MSEAAPFRAGHTPGPWRVDDDVLGCEILCIMQAGKPINSAAWVAQIGLGKESECDPGFDESHANARLIAAAPDLLEIAVEFMRRWHGPVFYELGHDDLAERCQAAIAKATGEAA